MAYMIDLSAVLAETLGKLTTLNRHQLAGHAANLDFWREETKHCLAVIDGYHHRFDRMKDAQMKHAAEHHTIQFLLDDPCCTGEPATPPRRVPDAEIKAVRRALCDAFYRFIVRCYNDRLIERNMLESATDSLGIGIEASDLKR
ncbi:MAG: hypothetical protein ACM3U2_03685 [Deltaproteobacteria bacterium]